MRQISMKQALLATAVLAFGALGSVEWSSPDGLVLSIESAQARVGRPATPVSVAGVARRTTRRAVVGSGRRCSRCGLRPGAGKWVVCLSLKRSAARRDVSVI